MRLGIRSPRDFWCGLTFIAVGLGAAFVARGYAMSGGSQIGPAYFPTMLGLLLAMTGAVSGIRAFMRDGEGIAAFSIGRSLPVLASVAMFGLLARGAGVFVAVMVTVMLSSLASRAFRPLPFALFAAGMAGFCSLVFVKGLGLPLPIFGPWL